MATTTRPKPVHGSRSFTRMEAAAVQSDRKRANTLQDSGIPAVPEARKIEANLPGKKSKIDVFENNEDDEAATGDVQVSGPELKLPSTFDDLPIEIKSLAERFLESLSAKVHPTPLNADQLSELFQEFYERAASHIATHIASLASRIGRRSTSQSSTVSRGSIKGRSRAGSGAKVIPSDEAASVAGGEMLTASEVTDRKKARRLLELKRLALEEAVEQGVCAKIYEKIWKHRSTDDEARDEKLRSRAAALALVGIGLKELHMDTDGTKADVRKTAEEKADEINQSLFAAREALQKMDDEHYPLGKLQHLKAAHKSIVETLSQLFPSSSSADEILPTLIYTLITSASEGINVVSNLSFIQRFRASSKVDGEAAYCMVNLEAAISFLETVDLSSLRSDEPPQGPPKTSSRPSTPLTETPPLVRPTVARTVSPGLTPISVTSSEQSSSSNSAVKALPSPVTPNTSTRPQYHRRRLSSLVQAQAVKIEAGRENFLNAADKVYESINGTLDNSLQFIFGRFKEQVAEAPDSPSLPKTLEEARKLVSSPSALADDEDSLSLGDRSGRSSPSVVEDPLTGSGKTDSKLLELVGGRRQLRDHSVDSARSGGSGKRVSFAAAAGALAPKDQVKDDLPPTAPPANLFASINSINPLNRFGMPTFPRFGRPVPAGGGQPAQPSPTTERNARLGLGEIVESPSSLDGTASSSALEEKQRSGGESSAGTLDLNSREALAQLRKIKPPRQRFLEVQGAGDLKIGEVEDLLLEYRRLAKAIADAIAI